MSNKKPSDKPAIHIATWERHARTFRIEVGLVPGYGNHGQTHTVYDLINAHHEWQRANGVIQGIIVTQGHVSYGWPSPEANGGIYCAEEPIAVVEGQINPLYDAPTSLSDDAACKRIYSLAEWLRNALQQERVYVIGPVGEAVIIQAKDAKLPAPDPQPAIEEKEPAPEPEGNPTLNTLGEWNAQLLNMQLQMSQMREQGAANLIPWSVWFDNRVAIMSEMVDHLYGWLNEFRDQYSAHLRARADEE